MPYLDRIADCNTADLSGYRPFVVDGRAVGLLTPDMVKGLADHADVFTPLGNGIQLRDGLEGRERRTEAVGDAVRRLIERGLIGRWRGEYYVVGTGWSDPVMFDLDRGAVPSFGVLGYGVHINGFTHDAQGAHMWVGKRALTKPSGPGKMDQMVAGGQPSGLGLMENVIKECAEEADLPEALSAKAVPVGAISYIVERPEGLRRDILFNYDLELPADVTPANTDGEVEAFHRWPLARVVETVRDTDDFKFNCALVVMDFLIRHGHLPPEDPAYLDLQMGLRRPVDLAGWV